MTVTSGGEELGHSRLKVREDTAMKVIAISIIAFAIVAVSVVAAAAVRKTAPQRAMAEEPCVGLSCWPASPPVKHRPGQRLSLEPVW